MSSPMGRVCPSSAIVGAVLVALAVPAGAPASAQAATCAASSKLYIKTGVGEIRTVKLSCRSARRILHRWGNARGNIRGVAPAGWRCTIKGYTEPPGGADYRCRRGAMRMNFLTGG